MSSEEINVGKDVVKPEPLPEGVSDSELAIFLLGHIENPCTVEVAPGIVKNIRNFYLREAERLIPGMTNPDIIELLKDKIREYA